MNSIPSRNAPFIGLLFIDNRVSALKITRIFEQCIVFVSDIFARYPLLNNRLAPVVVKPWLSDFLLTGARTQ